LLVPYRVFFANKEFYLFLPPAVKSPVLCTETCGGHLRTPAAAGAVRPAVKQLRLRKRKNFFSIHNAACGKCVKSSKRTHFSVENSEKERLFAIDKTLVSVQSVGVVGCKLR
jgi:hypothetical protein